MIPNDDKNLYALAWHDDNKTVWSRVVAWAEDGQALFAGTRGLAAARRVDGVASVATLTDQKIAKHRFASTDRWVSIPCAQPFKSRFADLAEKRERRAAEVFWEEPAWVDAHA